MNILIAGASGFIGQALVSALQQQHNITVLGRSLKILQNNFESPIEMITWEDLEPLDAKRFDAIINLCGYNISAKRWNPEIKALLISSRINPIQTLTAWMLTHSAKPHFICANAVGVYGTQSNGDPAVFTEDNLVNDNPSNDFLKEIGLRWQDALQPAIDAGIPVTITRFGVVLRRGQGMLEKLLPSFYFGLGSVIGDGRQIISWVHIDDVVGAISFLLARPLSTGVFNLTSPNPVSQAEFAKRLANSLHRPLFLKMPSVMIKALFGEMGESLLLKGQRVMPKRLMDLDYQFLYPKLADALYHEYEKTKE